MWTSVWHTRILVPQTANTKKHHLSGNTLCDSFRDNQKCLWIKWLYIYNEASHNFILTWKVYMCKLVCCQERSWFTMLKVGLNTEPASDEGTLCDPRLLTHRTLYARHNHKHRDTARCDSSWQVTMCPTRCRRVGRMTRLGSGPLCNCILTSPIQKAHISTHTHTRTTKTHPVVRYTNPVHKRTKKTWTSRPPSASSHGCNVTTYIFKRVYTGKQYLCLKTRHAFDTWAVQFVL